MRDHDFNVEELNSLSVSVEGGEAVQFTCAPAAVGLHFDEIRGVLTTLLFLFLHYVVATLGLDIADRRLPF